MDKTNKITCLEIVDVMLYKYSTGADPGFDQGRAPDRDRPKLPMVHSSVM